MREYRVEYLSEGEKFVAGPFTELKKLVERRYIADMDNVSGVVFMVDDTEIDLGALNAIAEGEILTEEAADAVIRSHSTLLETFKVKNRVRGGGRNIQRKKRVSSKKGWTYDAKKKTSKKIDAVSRLKMKKTAKRSALKRKSKRAQADVKRRRSNRMRKSLGFDKR